MSGIFGGFSGLIGVRKGAAVTPATAFKVGSFSLNTSTGNQSVTGIGFPPKGIIFLGSIINGNGNAANAVHSLGMGSSSSARMTYSVKSDDNADPNLDNYYFSSANILTAYSVGTTKLYEMDLVSLDSDGFTVSLTTAPGTTRTVFYAALGGTSVSCKGGKIDIAASISSQAFTGIGFPPKATLFAGGISGTTEGLINGSFVTSGFFGCGVSSSARWVNGLCSNWFNVPTSEKADQSTALAMMRVSVGDRPVTADFTSNDADGFTLNVTRADTGPRTGILSLTSSSVKAGSFNQKTSTGSQSITGVGFPPKFLLLSSFGKATAAGQIADAKRSIGFASGATERGYVASASTDASTPKSAASSRISNANILGVITAGGATPTVLSEADLTSFDADGFTLNWGTADATAREICYLAVG